MRQTILDMFKSVFESEHLEFPGMEDSTVLMETGLDSLAFAVLVIQLEEELGFDPFSLSDESYYPRTFGEFVEFYEKNAPG